MLQQRETATDRLADVIQVIRLGRRTGTLTVERGQGATFEEGSITFVNGQSTQAQVGRLNGQEALAWLKTWNKCLFAFIAQAASGTTSIQHSSDTHFRGQTTGIGIAPGPLNRVTDRGKAPHRIKSLEESLALIEQMKFSRTCRRLLLLIDGKRTIEQLGRLVGRSEAEVTQQLDELERAGLIQQ